jgi:hypothetical protein
MDYKNYYLNQLQQVGRIDYKTYYEQHLKGAGFPVFSGYHNQRGHGIGAWLKRIFLPSLKNYAVPLLKPVGEVVKTELVKSSANIAIDVKTWKNQLKDQEMDDEYLIDNDHNGDNEEVNDGTLASLLQKKQANETNPFWYRDSCFSQ